MIVSKITAWGVQWTGFPTARGPDWDCQIKDNLYRYCPKTFEMAKGKIVFDLKLSIRSSDHGGEGGIPHAVISLAIIHNQQVHTAIKHIFHRNSHVCIPHQSSCKWSTLNTSLPVWRTGIGETAVQQRSVCGCLPLDTQTCHLWLGPAMQSGTWTRGKPWRESPLWTEEGFGHSHTGRPL